MKIGGVFELEETSGYLVNVMFKRDFPDKIKFKVADV